MDTPRGFIVCLTLLAACRSLPHDAVWREQQRLPIAEAVLQDLSQIPPLSENDLRTTLCIDLADQVGKVNRDPIPALLADLRRSGVNAFPTSACEVRGTLMRRDSPEYAILLGVGNLEWKEDDFVRVIGWRWVSPVAADEWAYTLSFSQGRWTVDTARIVRFA